MGRIYQEDDSNVVEDQCSQCAGCALEELDDEYESGEEEYAEDEESDWDDENHSIIRAKWVIDGAKNLDEVIEKYLEEIEFIKRLKADGWELTDAVDDDYGYMKRTPTTVAAS